MRPTVLSLGYCTLDVIRYNGAISHRAGGTAANVAANLAYLGWQAIFAGRLGRDSAGRRITDDLRRAGVSVDLLARDASLESPVIVHDVTPPNHNFLFRCPRCGRRFARHRPISDAQLGNLLDHAPAADVFFFDRASAPAIRLAPALRERGTLVVFEPSAPGVPARTLAAAETADILKCSHERREQIDVRLLSPRDGQLQIETLGSRGLRFRRGAERWKIVPAPRVAVVDAGGAGDWLTAAFLATIPRTERLDTLGNGVGDLLARAQATAALSCRLVGARTLAEIPLQRVHRAAAKLLAGDEPQFEAVRVPRPSRARVSCPTCLC